MPDLDILQVVQNSGITRLRVNTEHFNIHNFEGQFYVVPVSIEGAKLLSKIDFAPPTPEEELDKLEGIAGTEEFEPAHV